MMCVSSPVYPVIIDNMRSARQTQTGRLNTNRELEPGPVGETKMMVTTRS